MELGGLASRPNFGIKLCGEGPETTEREECSRCFSFTLIYRNSKWGSLTHGTKTRVGCPRCLPPRCSPRCHSCGAVGWCPSGVSVLVMVEWLEQSRPHIRSPADLGPPFSGRGLRLILVELTWLHGPVPPRGAWNYRTG